MEVPGGDKQWLRVLSYEFFGTAVLTYVVLVSGGAITAVPTCLFFLILIGGPISGGHFNPAVTIAVYIMES